MKVNDTLIFDRIINIINLTKDLQRFEKEEVIDRLMSNDPTLDKARLEHNVGEALLFGVVVEAFDIDAEEGFYSITPKTMTVLRNMGVM